MTATPSPVLSDLVEELRALSERLVRGDLDEQEAAYLADALRARRPADSASPVPPIGPTTPWFWALAPEHRDGSAGWWRDNPVAPPVRLWWEDAELHGHARLGLPFTGPVGRVHGGFVAAVLDHVLAHLLVGLGRQGMTTELHVSYVRATPLDTDLDLRAGCASHDGRRTTAWAEVRHAGTVTARAIGSFVTPTPPATAGTPVTTSSSLERSTTP